MGNKIQGMFANIKAKAQTAAGAGAPKQADEEEKKEPAEGEEVPKIWKLTNVLRHSISIW